MRRPSLYIACTALLTSCALSDDGNSIVSHEYVHKYGFPISQAEWEAREQDGKEVLVLDNGVKVTRTFENGILHGPSTFTFPHSEVVEKLHVYESGTLLKQLVNDPNGLPLREEAYGFDDRLTVTLWNEKGAPLSIEEYEGDTLLEGSYFTPDHALEAKVENGLGERVRRERDGLLLSRDSIVHGAMAARTTYHASGQIHTISHYDNGQLTGEQLKFTATGRPLMALNWDHGTLHGTKVVFRNGQKVAEIPYVHGVKEGVEFHYDELGYLTAEISWHHDKRHGTTKLHNDQTVETEWFFDGTSVSAERFQRLENNEQMVADLSDSE